MNEEYEVVIIGGGPAGLTTGLYTSRDRLNSLLIEGGMVGGQIASAERVENYPGFPEGIGGFELGQLMHQQATKHGLKTLLTEGDFIAKAIVVASGSERHKLGVPGEEEFAGKGVSYCSTCDAPFFREQPIAIVGGGDAAITEALHLTKFASKVTVIHRRHELRASRILQEKAFSQPKMEFLWDTIVEKIEGGEFVKTIGLYQVITGERSTLDVAGLFISIGLKPNTDYLKGILPLDATGHIITNEKMETEIPGILAAGDVHRNSARQAITAAGDGATAAMNTKKFLSE